MPSMRQFVFALQRGRTKMQIRLKPLGREPRFYIFPKFAAHDALSAVI